MVYVSSKYRWHGAHGIPVATSQQPAPGDLRILGILSLDVLDGLFFKRSDVFPVFPKN